MDIVIVGLQQWYTKIGSNCKNIAIQFSKDHRVLYVNSPLDRRTAMAEKDNPDVQYHLQVAEGKADMLREVAPNIWALYPPTRLESINWIPFTPVFQFMNRRNNKKFAADIRQAATKLGFKDLVVFNDNDMFRGYFLKEFLHPKQYIYYSRDYLLGVDYWRKHGAELEPKHIAKSDLAVANSLYLTDMLLQYNPNSFYVGQGCDLSLFDANVAHALPEDIRHIARPMIGYVGSLNALRLNVELLEQIARSRPDWQLVLVGPEDDVFKASALHTMANVHFTGSKPVPSLPSYIAAFDVCLNPQVINSVTIGNYPLKIDEYLAMGKATVATATKTMSLFKDHVYLAETPDQYVPLIEQALRENNLQLQQARINFARTHSWENSVAAIYAAMQHKA